MRSPRIVSQSLLVALATTLAACSSPEDPSGIQRNSTDWGGALGGLAGGFLGNASAGSALGTSVGDAYGHDAALDRKWKLGTAGGLAPYIADARNTEAEAKQAEQALNDALQTEDDQKGLERATSRARKARRNLDDEIKRANALIGKGTPDDNRALGDVLLDMRVTRSRLDTRINAAAAIR